jgi:hypothetical protein
MSITSQMNGIPMREIILSSIVFVAGLVAPLLTQAQGTLFVSNIGQASGGSAGIGSDSWLAQRFITGTNAGGYLLNSAQLLMEVASGSPNGFTVSLYGNSGSGPASNLGSLSGPDPTSGGVFTYATSGIMLSPSTLYFVVATAATPTAQGAYNWSAANESAVTDGWFIPVGYNYSADGLSWQLSRQYTFQMAIYATAVPEPATLALAALALGALSFRWRKP